MEDIDVVVVTTVKAGTFHMTLQTFRILEKLKRNSAGLPARDAGVVAIIVVIGRINLIEEVALAVKAASAIHPVMLNEKLLRDLILRVLMEMEPGLQECCPPPD